MAVPRLAVILIAGVLLVPAAFLASRVAAGGGSDPAKPAKPVQAAANPGKSGGAPGNSGAAPGKSGAAPGKAAAAKTDAAAAQPKPDPAAAERKKAAAAGLPGSVAVALAKGQTVVLLLSDGKSADDRSTTDAVRELRGAKNVKVFTDRLSRLGSYRAIVGRVGVTQSPAVVVIRGSKARVVEGYVDPETLRQQVIDAGQ
jgi:hypothetical protein